MTHPHSYTTYNSFSNFDEANLEKSLYSFRVKENTIRITDKFELSPSLGATGILYYEGSKQCESNTKDYKILPVAWYKPT